MAVPCDTSSPLGVRDRRLEVGDLAGSRTTSPRTASVSPALAARIVEYVIEIVAARSPVSSAALVAKFIAASCTTRVDAAVDRARGVAGVLGRDPGRLDPALAVALEADARAGRAAPSRRRPVTGPCPARAGMYPGRLGRRLDRTVKFAASGGPNAHRSHRRRRPQPARPPQRQAQGHPPRRPRGAHAPGPRRAHRHRPRARRGRDHGLRHAGRRPGASTSAATPRSPPGSPRRSSAPRSTGSAARRSRPRTSRRRA